METLLETVPCHGHTIQLIHDNYAASPLEGAQALTLTMWDSYNHLPGLLDFVVNGLVNPDNKPSLTKMIKRINRVSTRIRRKEYCRLLARHYARSAGFIVPVLVRNGIITLLPDQRAIAADGVIFCDYSLGHELCMRSRKTLAMVAAVVNAENDHRAGMTTGYRIDTTPLVESWGHPNPDDALTDAKNFITKLIEAT